MERLALLSSNIPSERVVTVLLMFFGSVVGLGPLCASNRDEIGPLVLSLVFSFGLILFIAGIVIANKCQRVDVFLDRSSGNLVVQRKGWFSTKVETGTFPSSEVRKIEIEKTVDSDGDAWYQLILKVNSGQQYAISKRSMITADIMQVRDKFEGILSEKAIGAPPSDRNPSTSSISATSESSKLVVSGTSKFVSVFVFLVVVAIPFVAGYMADHTSFAQVTVATGVPDANTVGQVKQMTTTVLKPGESILWVGQPEVGREGDLKMWFFMPFAVLWTLFSITWVSLAAHGTIRSKNPAGILMVLFGAPFVLIGLAMLTTPYFSRQQELSTVYALTNKGAIKVVSNHAYRIVEYKEQDFGPVEVTHYGDTGRADILFVKDASEGQKRPYGGFYGVKDPDTAASILNGSR